MYHPFVFIANRLRRGLAAALSAVALVSAIARPVLACEMGRGEPAAASADQGAHAHHAAPATPRAPETPPAPRSLGCDHLVGCVSMVVISAPAVSFATSSVPDAAPQSVVARHDAPVRALEPPPPRT